MVSLIMNKNNTNLEYARNYYSKNKEIIKKQVSDRIKKNRVKILEFYTHGTFKCSCCDVVGIEFLCIDHVNNDGNKQRKELRNLHSFYRWILKNNYPDSLQVLCHNCNMAKQIYGTCPHKKLSTV